LLLLLSDLLLGKILAPLEYGALGSRWRQEGEALTGAAW